MSALTWPVQDQQRSAACMLCHIMPYCAATLRKQPHSLAADYYKDRSSKLGPDPLREDADPERLWNKMKVSKKPVGGLLMDQTAVAGIGNIYRAEILFKVLPVLPHRLGMTVNLCGQTTISMHRLAVLTDSDTQAISLCLAAAFRIAILFHLTTQTSSPAICEKHANGG